MNERIHGGDIYSQRKDIVDLSVNLNPLGVSEEIRKALTEGLSSVDRYPDPLNRGLKKAISEYEGVPEKNIICGNGASALIFDLIRTLSPKKAVFTAPLFTEYERAAESLGAEKEFFFLREEEDFLPGRDLIDAVREDTDIFIIVNPNNPTGRLVPRDILLSLLKRCEETGTLLLVDECFLPLSDKGFSLEPFISEHKNLVVLKSFTKLYAIPDIRLGYALCSDPALIEKTERVRAPWSVSNLSERAGIAALQLKDLPERTAEFIKAEKEEFCKVFDILESKGLRYIRTDTVFILFFSPPLPEGDLYSELIKRNIMIRDCRDFTGLTGGWYRTAIGSKEMNRAFFKALKEIYGY